jgi:UDP-4-amino-4,6-dideoxy-N-acetyl-beta-L-altrosamine transaminase
MNYIPYSTQWIDEDDINAVIEVLKSDWLTQGPTIEKFEKALAQYCGAKYAIAVSNGTAALHLACLAAGIKYGDEVITSPITFVASANCILYCGGKPLFVDIDKDTYNIDPDKIKGKITSRTKAIIPVHFAGLPCDMEIIKKIADKYNLIIIEDACHALGAEYKSQRSKIGSQKIEKEKNDWIKVGSCHHSAMAVFSFHPVKHITTGEGGAVITNSEELYGKLLLLRNHGITKNSSKFKVQNPKATGPWYYEMQDLGFNCRITDIQCALGLSQLKKINSFVARRREIAAIYNKTFKNLKYIKIPVVSETRKSAYHLYVVQIDFKKLGKSRSSIMNALKEEGIGTQVHYIPVHLQPYYRSRLGYKEKDYPVAEKYYSKALSLPLYPKMTVKEIKRVIYSITDVLK